MNNFGPTIRTTTRTRTIEEGKDQSLRMRKVTAGIAVDSNGEKKASTSSIGEREGAGRVEGDRRERNFFFRSSEKVGIARPRGSSNLAIVLVLVVVLVLDL